MSGQPPHHYQQLQPPIAQPWHVMNNHMNGGMPGIFRLEAGQKQSSPAVVPPPVAPPPAMVPTPALGPPPALGLTPTLGTHPAVGSTSAVAPPPPMTPCPAVDALPIVTPVQNTLAQGNNDDDTATKKR